MAEREEMGEDGLVAEIEKKITEAFEVFDRESNKTVDVSNYTAETAAAELSERKGLGAKWFPIREIGCIVRSLGCFPTEAEVQELLEKIEVEEPGGFVHLEHFLPVMTKVLLDRRFRPIPEDVILHAFEALDENKCGYITKDDLVKHLTQGGEPFTQEEMEDMLAVALDPVTDTLHYRDYRTKLIVDETKTFPFNV